MGFEKAVTVNLSGELADHVSDAVGEYGLYASEDEFIRDLIRRDRSRVVDERFAVLKAQLQQAFAQPQGPSVPIDADAFIDRMKRQG